MSQPCTAKTEVWARVCGFFRPLKQWNRGQRAQYAERTPYRPDVGAPLAAPESDQGKTNQGEARLAPTGDPHGDR